jgi:hypothetical protein
MTLEEKQQLQTAISTIADPRGNWAYGWKLLCQLADIDPEKMQPPFTKPKFLDEQRRAG